MSHPAGEEELEVILSGEFYGHMLPEGGRTLPDVHRHIEYGTADHPDKFRLGMFSFLEMEPPDDAVG